MTRFSDEQIRRYSRQILLRELGGHGQSRLSAARPTLLCAGAVGEVAADYLWRAGVTELALFSDTPERAARFSVRLTAAGYPGPPARAQAAAAPRVQRLAEAAPGFTLLWTADGVPSAQPLQHHDDHASWLWAGCSGALGFVGQGGAALRSVAQAHPAGPACAGGALAMTVGSALALLALQRLAGLTGLPGDSPELPGAVWRIDLDSAALPEWAAR